MMPICSGRGALGDDGVTTPGRRLLERESHPTPLLAGHALKGSTIIRQSGERKCELRHIDRQKELNGTQLKPMAG